MEGCGLVPREHAWGNGLLGRFYGLEGGRWDERGNTLLLGDGMEPAAFEGPAIAAPGLQADTALGILANVAATMLAMLGAIARAHETHGIPALPTQKGAAAKGSRFVG